MLPLPLESCTNSGIHPVIVFKEKPITTQLKTLIPVFAQQLARFFHACPPDLHHFIVVSLVEPAVVAILEMFPH